MDEEINNLIIRRNRVLAEICAMERMMYANIETTLHLEMVPELTHLNYYYIELSDRIQEAFEAKQKKSFWKKFFRK